MWKTRYILYFNVLLIFLQWVICCVSEGDFSMHCLPTKTDASKWSRGKKWWTVYDCRLTIEVYKRYEIHTWIFPSKDQHSKRQIFELQNHHWTIQRNEETFKFYMIISFDKHFEVYGFWPVENYRSNYRSKIRWKFWRTKEVRFSTTDLILKLENHGEKA